MKTRITIGLTYTGTEEKHNNYVNWLKGGEDIEIIKLCADDHNLDAVKKVDAVVLSGGVDAHPKNYGSDVTDYPNAPATFNEKRDDFETEVFNASQQQHIPVLGICRGMQLINCVLGGDLTQDIGPDANASHRNEGHDKTHAVHILGGTLLSDITKTGDAENDAVEGDANSAHHQAINTLGEGLIINAASSDGLAEGIEWADKTNKPFLLGVQWHPERMYKLNMEASPLAKNIREYFINEIKKSKGIL